MGAGGSTRDASDGGRGESEILDLDRAHIRMVARIMGYRAAALGCPGRALTTPAYFNIDPRHVIPRERLVTISRPETSFHSVIDSHVLFVHV